MLARRRQEAHQDDGERDDDDEERQGRHPAWPEAPPTRGGCPRARITRITRIAIGP